MRRFDPLEWLLIAATLLAFGALGQAVFLQANAGLVNPLSAAVTASKAAASPSDAAPAGGSDMASAHAAIDGASTAMAASIAEELDRDATRLAATLGALLVVLVAAAVVRARQLSRARVS